MINPIPLVETSTVELSVQQEDIDLRQNFQGLGDKRPRREATKKEVVAKTSLVNGVFFRGII